MKCFGKTVIGLASALATIINACADDTVSSNNPYASIAARNIFCLQPPPAAMIVPSTNELPPKITPNGTMSIFGSVQVIFKIMPQRNQAIETSYIMSEGEQQDDIKVLHIDAKAGLVTFNNHGIVQQIPLADANIKTPTGPETPSQILFRLEHPNG